MLVRNSLRQSASLLTTLTLLCVTGGQSQADDEVVNVGPDVCIPRGTLFQWSYGTSFSGGPNLAEPLITDRPDFTEASSTVGRGVAQLEFGYTHVHDDEGGDTAKSHSIGEPLLRYGVFADWLEFRLAIFPSGAKETTNGVGSNVSGLEDLYLGFKIGLTPQEGILPEMAVITQMTVPTGHTDFTNNEVLPGINWLYSWEITDTFAIGGSTQGNRSIDEGTGQAYLELAQSMTAVFTLSDELSTYTEWYAFFPHSADTAQVEHYFNGGFAYLISNDIQFDIRAGTGLNRAATDFFVGTGLTIRFQ